MSCDRTEKVSLLIDGELPESEAREVQRHLLQCVHCQQAQTDFLSLRNQIGAYVPQLEPISQREALNRILNRKPTKVRAGSVLDAGWTWRFSPRLAAFATLIVLAAIVGLVLYRSMNRQPNQQIQAQVQKQNPVEQPSVENKQSTNQKSQADATAPSPTPTPTTKPAPSPVPKVPVWQRPSAPDPPTFASNSPRLADPSVIANVRSGDAQTLTAMHLEKSELLLRAFRNIRVESGRTAEVDYERKQARQLVLQNMMLRREADSSGDVQVAGLLENLEPILLDIANLRRNPAADDIEVIKERVERKNIVALLQVNSTALARALD